MDLERKEKKAKKEEGELYDYRNTHTLLGLIEILHAYHYSTLC